MKKRRPHGKRHPAQRITIPDCKRFTGYKPCFPGTECYRECVDPDPIGRKILIVNLDAMGNVLVTTSLLPAIKRKFPKSHISWITLKNAAPLLQHNRYLDRVYVWEPESWLVLQQITFDTVMNIDKSARSCAFTMTLRAKEKLGFGLNKDGVIVPLNKEAHENYLLGLDDHFKFRVNQKPVSRILCETLKLKYKRDEYILSMTDEEQQFCKEYKQGEKIQDARLVVGFNTGCSEALSQQEDEH